MACITFAQPLTVATTQLVRAIHYENAPVCRVHGAVESSSVSLSWVVVTDSNGKRYLKMLWTPAADAR